MATGRSKPRFWEKKTDVLTVDLPFIFTRDSLYILVNTLLQGLRQDPKRAVLNFANLSQIQVGGIAILSNMIELYRKAGIKVDFLNAKSCGAAGFLCGSGFHSVYLDGKIVGPKADEKFLPLKLVTYDRSHSYLDDQLVPWLAAILGIDVRALASLRVCFEEIFNNIKDHSMIDVGCSCAHFNQTEGMITICISDFGVGIPNNVRKKMAINSDHGAISMACQEGFTTQSTVRNMGAGLHVLIRNVVTRNSGSVIIHSGKGIYSCTPAVQHGKVKRTGRTAPHGSLYPGTLIYVTLDTKKFVPSEIDKEAFAWE